MKLHQLLAPSHKPRNLSLEIMGKTIEIRYVPWSGLKPFADKGEKIYGYFDEVPGVVYIDNTLDKSVQDRILLHELVHVTLGICGVSNLIKIDLEEGICDALENWIGII